MSLKNCRYNEKRELVCKRKEVVERDFDSRQVSDEFTKTLEDTDPNVVSKGRKPDKTIEVV